MREGKKNFIWPDKSFQLLVNERGMNPENRDPNIDKRWFVKVSNANNVVVWKSEKYLSNEEFDPYYFNEKTKLRVYDNVKNGDYLIVMNMGTKIENVSLYSLQREIMPEDLSDLDLIEELENSAGKLFLNFLC